MTANEIQIMANGGKCVIKTHEGKYLGLLDHKQRPCLVDDPKDAKVYSYVGDNVPGQLAMVENTLGFSWTVEPI